MKSRTPSSVPMGSFAMSSVKITWEQDVGRGFAERGVAVIGSTAV